ncbi:hypothetical protein LCGC14_0052140 [marine sediment metagenome]|uniref:Peptidase M50 domain-containing protein n=1 Tax=marine sediment metagenome TaxID=412755 RepID=A0A0F9Y7G9_9ZZZZ|nr:hypothetical protein [Maribacter sp.]HDZ06440.1 hypothetical protein [Maribacter sp.]HEA78885.1 hypothetical protein [Maribacter sp.]
MNDQKVSVKYILAGILAVVLTWIIHELTHWFTSEFLGYETILRLNGTSSVEGENPTEIHKAIISISAPIITILQGLIVFMLIKSRGWNKYVYPFLFTAFYMRFLAGFMNLIMPNDEARVGQFLGIGTFTLSIIVSGLLFFMVYKISKQYQLNWKFQLWTFIIILLASWILILSDQFFGIRLI